MKVTTTILGLAFGAVIASACSGGGGDAGASSSSGGASSGSTSSSSSGATSGSSSGGFGSEGAPCADGDNCTEGTFCFVKSNDALSGTCTKLPAACGGKSSCSCLDELKTQCTNAPRCQGLVGNVVLACGQNGEYKKTGEACSSVISCDTNNYCFSKGRGQAGTCTELPPACSGDAGAGCDCFTDAKGKCAAGDANCIGVNGLWWIQCR